MVAFPFESDYISNIGHRRASSDMECATLAMHGHNTYICGGCAERKCAQFSVCMCDSVKNGCTVMLSPDVVDSIESVLMNSADTTVRPRDDAFNVLRNALRCNPSIETVKHVESPNTRPVSSKAKPIVKCRPCRRARVLSKPVPKHQSSVVSHFQSG